MAALLVALSVMAIAMSVALPAWSHMIRREKEEELIFRGLQYARAINQYQRKFANASPQTLDILIEQRLLRKKFRDPLSPNQDGEFQMLYLQTAPPRGGVGRGTGSGSTGPGMGQGPGSRGTGPGGTAPGPGTGGSSIGPSPSGRGAIVGVASKNTGQSIRSYNGKNRYNEWQFIGMELSSQAGPGGGAGGAGRAGTQRGDGRGGRVSGGPNQGGQSNQGGQRGGRGGDGTFGGPGGGFGQPPRSRGF
jgi:type II secretory pathway pseudopilin PulG